MKTNRRPHAARPLKYLVGLAALGTLGMLLKRHTDKVVERVNVRQPAGLLVELPSGPLHLLEANPESANTAVLIHGSDGVVGDWPLSGLFERAGLHYRLLAYDRPGHGHTPVPPGVSVTVELNVRVLRELLRARGVIRPVLVGHSYGATVALAYALRYPQEVRGLLLISPTSFHSPALTNPLAHLILVPGLRELITRVLLLPVGIYVMNTEGVRAFHPAPLPRVWRDMMLAFSRRPSQALALAQENRSIPRELRQLASRYAELRVPCTIVAGRHDVLTPHEEHARPLARALPGSRLVALDTGHEVHWTHLDEVLAELDALFGRT